MPKAVQEVLQIAPKVEAAIARLEELRARNRRIDDRLRQLEVERNESERRLRLKEAELARALAGGLLEAPEMLKEEVQELKAALAALEGEAERLAAEKERLKVEQIEVLKGALEPAWRNHVKARKHELELAPKIVAKVRRGLEPLREARDRRQTADRELDRLLAIVGAIVGHEARHAVQSDLASRLPPPQVPEDFEGRRNYQTARELLRIFNAPVWASPEYGN